MRLKEHSRKPRASQDGMQRSSTRRLFSSASPPPPPPPVTTATPPAPAQGPNVPPTPPPPLRELTKEDRSALIHSHLRDIEREQQDREERSSQQRAILAVLRDVVMLLTLPIRLPVR